MKFFLAVSSVCELYSSSEGIYGGDLEIKYENVANLTSEELRLSNVLHRMFTAYQHAQKNKYARLRVGFCKPGSSPEEGLLRLVESSDFLKDIKALLCGQNCVLVKVTLSYSVKNKSCELGWSTEVSSKEMRMSNGEFEDPGITLPIIAGFKPFPDSSGSASSTTKLPSRYDKYITARVTVVVTVQQNKYSPRISSSISPVNKEMLLFRKMLHDEIHTDVVITSENGEQVKCHRAVLATCSSVFDTIFKTDMKESKTHQLNIADMTQKGVTSFLKYVYYQDVEGPNEDCMTAFELLKAAHKYKVAPAMESVMTRIILSKANEWFSVDMGMALFLFARNLPDGIDLKTKAAAVLKKNSEGLLECATYTEMFQENPAGAMELCQLVMKM